MCNCVCVSCMFHAILLFYTVQILFIKRLLSSSKLQKKKAFYVKNLKLTLETTPFVFQPCHIFIVCDHSSVMFKWTTDDTANTALDFQTLNPPGQIVFICVPSSVVTLPQHLNKLSSINRSVEKDTGAVLRLLLLSSRAVKSWVAFETCPLDQYTIIGPQD